MAKKKTIEECLSLIGKKFNYLTFEEYLGYYAKEGTKNKRHYYRCKCNCGNDNFVVSDKEVLFAGTKSCGCLKRKNTSDIFTTHGMSNSRLYVCWINMKKRCYNANNDKYPYYGGKNTEYY